MAYIEDEGRNQGKLFPVGVVDLISSDHNRRVIDAFVERVAMSELGFEDVQPARVPDEGRHRSRQGMRNSAPKMASAREPKMSLDQKEDGAPVNPAT
jgi:hypothetical protein